MEQKILKINENRLIAKNVYKLVLEGDIEKHFPGQFVNIKVPDMYLRRPISVCDYEPEKLTLCYKIVGGGTGILSTMKPGAALDVLTRLGNGYDLSRPEGTVLLIGGGMGTAPLYFLAKEITKNHTSTEVVIGFNTKDEIFLKEEFEQLGCRVTLATADGSEGRRGFVTDVLPKKYDYFYACGPLAMMKAVNSVARTGGEFSLEERMGCGFGACMGCSIKVKAEPAPENVLPGASPDTAVIYKRICKDGPVFKREEIIWED